MLPVGLEEMCKGMFLGRITSMDIDLSVQYYFLQSVAFAATILRLNELASALESGFADSNNVPARLQ